MTCKIVVFLSVLSTLLSTVCNAAPPRLLGASGGVTTQLYDHKGVQVSYKRAGDHNNPTMLFLHNGGTSHTIWRYLFEYFRANYDVIAVDLPGYGDSAKSETGYSFSQYVEFLSDFIHDHELSQLTLVGNCMGSAIALLYSSEKPENVRSLVLFNPLSELTFEGGELSSMRTVDHYASKFLDGLALLSRHIQPPRLAISMTLGRQIGSSGTAAFVHLDQDLHACYQRQEQLVSLRELLSGIGSYAAVDHLTPDSNFPPICTIWGNENKILSPTAGRKLNQKLNPICAEWINGCGHLVMLEAPFTVIELMERFLSGEHAKLKFSSAL